MRINETKALISLPIMVDNETLMNFLNSEVSDDDQDKDGEETLFILKSCVESLMRVKKYKADARKGRFRPIRRKLRKKGVPSKPQNSLMAQEHEQYIFDLNEKCYQDVWSQVQPLLDRLEFKILRQAHPSDIVAFGSGADKIESVIISDIFSHPGRLLVASPEWGNFVLAFLRLLWDPKLGVDKLFRCELCGKFAMSPYKRVQRWCSDKCRLTHHNELKAPKMAEYMRGYRETKKRMRSNLDKDLDD